MWEPLRMARFYRFQARWLMMRLKSDKFEKLFKMAKRFLGNLCAISGSPISFSDKPRRSFSFTMKQENVTDLLTTTNCLFRVICQPARQLLHNVWGHKNMMWNIAVTKTVSVSLLYFRIGSANDWSLPINICFDQKFIFSWRCSKIFEKSVRNSEKKVVGIKVFSFN